MRPKFKDTTCCQLTGLILLNFSLSIGIRCTNNRRCNSVTYRFRKYILIPHKQKDPTELISDSWTPIYNPIAICPSSRSPTLPFHAASATCTIVIQTCTPTPIPNVGCAKKPSNPPIAAPFSVACRIALANWYTRFHGIGISAVDAIFSLRPSM